MIAMRPPEVFDREHEWEVLASFAGDPRLPRLGIVSGRRRQGKSFLLRRLCSVATVRGSYALAQEQTRQLALEMLADSLGRQLGIPAAVRFPGWDDALRFFFQQAAGRLIVIDEFPFLLRHSPELPSVIQSLYDEARNDPAAPSPRLILCGSALSVMTELLSGQKPLRGRAVLDMSLRPFDFRDARRFWEIEDLDVAFRTHAIFGGTPGYRDLIEVAPPDAVAGLPAWLGRVFQPSGAMLSEAEYLLREDPRITDRALYQSVLTAISRGAGTPARISNVLARPDRSLAHPLTVLAGGGLIRHDEDMLRQRGGQFRLTDPIVRFSELVLNPRRGEFEERRGEQAIHDAEHTISAQILGPHFEVLAREWTARFASGEGLDDAPGPVGTSTISDPSGRTQHEVDVVALARGEVPSRREARVVLLGEAKGTNKPRGMADLYRLEHIRGLLTAQGTDAAASMLSIFSRSGFDRDLRRAAQARRDVLLIDLAGLYGA
ncbi:MAG: AAA family ATPase [Trebonia sp.]